MTTIKNWLSAANTDDRAVVRFLIMGYICLTLLCFLVLILPLAQSAKNSIVDHLFFAVSIVSTTGLVPADFGNSYNFFGQIMSLIFIQLGGIRYMALSSFIVLREYRKIPRLSVRLLRLEFNLPKRYPLLQFIYAVFFFTIIIELVGAIFLYYGFVEAGVERPIWNAIFHSVSAFCTAGFSLFSDSMVSMSQYPLIHRTILVLSLLGSIGFIVLLDFWLRLVRSRSSITLTSKIILISTFVFWMLGSALIYISDGELWSMGKNGLKAAIFQGISAHTTVGFNSYAIGTLDASAIFVLVALMIVGASPAGTGGGIKTTSIAVIWAVLMAILRRQKRITFLGKEIPSTSIYLAIASCLFYIVLFALFAYLILIVDGERFAFEQLVFEVASALSTVGLSMGITSDLSEISKLLISALMFIGRLGVLTFGFVLISRAPEIKAKLQVEDIAL